MPLIRAILPHRMIKNLASAFYSTSEMVINLL